MSLKPSPIADVPELTARVARVAFPEGNSYLRLRDELGPLFRDADFCGEIEPNPPTIVGPPTWR